MATNAGTGPVFFGQHAVALAPSGRLPLPAAFADPLAAGGMVTRGQERCLYLLPQSAFGQLGAQIASGGDGRAFTRMYFGGAAAATPDESRTIVLPEALRRYASLTSECVVVGANNRVEVWDATAWATYEPAAELLYEAMDEPTGKDVPREP